VVKKRPRAPDRMQLRAMAMARCVFPVPGGRDRCLGRSRGGLTTKIHALVDKKGRPIKLKLTAGQASDVASAPEMFADLPEDAMLIADKGYDANALRAAVAEKGAWANIPPKANRKDPICFSNYLYRACNLVERFFNKIKHFRRIAARYDKLAENFLAALKLAAIRIWLRDKESRPSLVMPAASPARLGIGRASVYRVLAGPNLEGAHGPRWWEDMESVLLSYERS
jgi:transposase